jgi:hypothetical protein
MKGAIKLLLIFMILSGFRTAAFGQSTADETITASATVAQVPGLYSGEITLTAAIPD